MGNTYTFCPICISEANNSSTSASIIGFSMLMILPSSSAEPMFCPNLAVKSDIKPLSTACTLKSLLVFCALSI
jgi:hypothetical protein